MRHFAEDNSAKPGHSVSKNRYAFDVANRIVGSGGHEAQNELHGIDGD